MMLKSNGEPQLLYKKHQLNCKKQQLWVEKKQQHIQIQIAGQRLGRIGSLIPSRPLNSIFVNLWTRLLSSTRLV